MKRTSIHSSLVIALVVATAPSFARAELPASPAETVTTVTRHLANHDATVLWDVLPPSYQRDVTILLRTWSNKMDKRTWDKCFSVLGSLAEVLRDKKNFIVSSQTFGDQKERAEYLANYDLGVHTLDTIVQSDLKSLEKLKKLDPATFMESVGNQLMRSAAELATAEGNEDPFASLSKVQAKEKQQHENGNVTVTISAPGEQPVDVEFTSIEGRWLPVEMAQGWAQMMIDAHEALAKEKAPKEGDQRLLNTVFEIANAVEGAINQIKVVKTQQQWDQTAPMAAMTAGMRIMTAVQMYDNANKQNKPANKSESLPSEGAEDRADGKNQ